MVSRILVTGPSRSGKSEWAECLAAASAAPVIYIATAISTPEDPEWQARIAEHQARRPSHWQLWESPIALAETLEQLPADHCGLVDSLGTWVANTLGQDAAEWHTTVQKLSTAIEACPATLILVAEETGWGIVPAYASGRRFRDRLGQLCCQLQPLMTEVYLVAAGFALPLHQLGIPLPAARLS